MSDMREGLAFLHIESQTDYAVLVGSSVDCPVETSSEYGIAVSRTFTHHSFYIDVAVEAKRYRGPPNTDNQPLHKMTGDFWTHQANDSTTGKIHINQKKVRYLWDGAYLEHIFCPRGM